jgi:hypothetical protein
MSVYLGQLAAQRLASQKLCGFGTFWQGKAAGFEDREFCASFP